MGKYETHRNIQSKEDGAAYLISEILKPEFSPCQRCFLDECKYESAHGTEKRGCMVFRLIVKSMDMEAKGINPATTPGLDLVRWGKQDDKNVD